MIPTKKQWSKWSLPSKYSAAGALIGVIALMVALSPSLERTNELTSIEYAGNRDWYLDSELTIKHLPESTKEFFNNTSYVFSDQILELSRDALGTDNDEYKRILSKRENPTYLLEALLGMGRLKLTITDKRMIFTSGNSVTEVHSKPLRVDDGECSESYSLQFNQVDGAIISVSRKGITFKVPSQRFVEHSISSCDMKNIEVDFLPASAVLEGSSLVVTHPDGLRYWVEVGGKKTVKREDIRLFYTTNRNNPE